MRTVARVETLTNDASVGAPGGACLPHSKLRSGARDLAAVPSIGRANRVEGATPHEAELTRAFFERYANQIFRYCLHQLGSREEAEDAVQSTFLNAFRGLKRGVVPELESAWLFKIAHNVCLSRRRSTWRRGRIESPADFELVEELTPAPAHRADELIGLQDVLEQMPETQRRAILLREWQGLSYREIAAELEVSQPAVETLIFRARRALATGLEQPPERQRRRVARAADWGNAVAVLKSLLVGGGAAAKVAAAVAVVGATAVVAAAPRHSQPPKPVRAVSDTPTAPVAARKLALPPLSRSSVPRVKARPERTSPAHGRYAPTRASQAGNSAHGQARSLGGSKGSGVGGAAAANGHAHRSNGAPSAKQRTKPVVAEAHTSPNAHGVRSHRGGSVTKTQLDQPQPKAVAHAAKVGPSTAEPSTAAPPAGKGDKRASP